MGAPRVVAIGDRRAVAAPRVVSLVPPGSSASAHFHPSSLPSLFASAPYARRRPRGVWSKTMSTTNPECTISLAQYTYNARLTTTLRLPFLLSINSRGRGLRLMTLRPP